MEPSGRGRGRPRRSPSDRRTQLRLAKRAQRERDRREGRVLCQVKLRPQIAELLREGLRLPGFEEDLLAYLDDALVALERYPNLKLLCWNRRGRYVSAREAFALYERNWRFVDRNHLEERERALIERLTARFGNGVLNV